MNCKRKRDVGTLMIMHGLKPRRHNNKSGKNSNNGNGTETVPTITTEELDGIAITTETEQATSPARPLSSPN